MLAFHTVFTNVRYSWLLTTLKGRPIRLKIFPYLFSSTIDPSTAGSGTTSIGIGTLAVEVAIHELTDVLVSIGPGIGALAINTVTTDATYLLPPALSRDQKQNNAPPEQA